jgi:hypothetical protein
MARGVVFMFTNYHGDDNEYVLELAKLFGGYNTYQREEIARLREQLIEQIRSNPPRPMPTGPVNEKG